MELMTAESPAPRYRDLSFCALYGAPTGPVSGREVGCRASTRPRRASSGDRPLPFAALGLYERADLQRPLRDDLSALEEDLFVIAEEFGN